MDVLRYALCLRGLGRSWPASLRLGGPTLASCSWRSCVGTSPRYGVTKGMGNGTKPEGVTADARREIVALIGLFLIDLVYDSIRHSWLLRRLCLIHISASVHYTSYYSRQRVNT